MRTGALNIDSTRLSQEWRILTEGGARFPGSEAERSARAYLQSQLRETGLDVREHTFPLQGWELHSVPRLLVTHPTQRRLEAAAFIYSSPTRPDGISGSLEYVGDHWVIGLYRWRKFRIVGKDGRTLGYVSGRGDGPAIPQPLAEGSSPLPHFIVGIEDLDWLIKRVSEDGSVSITGFLKSELHRDAIGTNVVAHLPGREDSGKRVAVCAHLDSVYGCPGANDNGGGLLAVLSLARYYAEVGCERSIDFILFAGEEWDLAGSKAYVADHIGTPAIDDVVALINLDGIAEAIEELQVWSGPEALEARLYRAIEGYEDSLGSRLRRNYKSPPPPGSDHMPFFAVGIPAIMLTGFEMKKYHSPLDVRHEAGRQSIEHVADLTRHLIDTVNWDVWGDSKRDLIEPARETDWEYALSLKQY